MKQKPTLFIIILICLVVFSLTPVIKSVYENACSENNRCRIYDAKYSTNAIWSIFLPVIFLAIAVFFSSQEVFRRWFYLTLIFVPGSIIFLNTSFDKGYDREDAALYLSGGYIIVSIVIFILGVVRHNKNLSLENNNNAPQTQITSQSQPIRKSITITQHILNGLLIAAGVLIVVPAFYYLYVLIAIPAVFVIGGIGLTALSRVSSNEEKREVKRVLLYTGILAIVTTVVAVLLPPLDFFGI